MSGAEESTVTGGVARVQACITDCSLINQTSCEAVTRGQLVTTADQVSTMCRVTPDSVSCWDLSSVSSVITMKYCLGTSEG